MALGDLVPWKRRERGLDVRRDYDDPLGALFGQMNRWFDMAPFGLGRGESGLAAFTPSVDVSEDDKEVRITSELPGIDEKDIDITLAKDAVTIKGEKKHENEDKGKDYYRMERSYGSFQRVIPLPAAIDEDKAKAEFKKGVLHITLPKTSEARQERKRIEVKGS